MDSRKAFTYGVIVIAVFLVGVITGVYLERADISATCSQDIKYHIAVLEKLPTESTGVFFERVQVTIDCLNVHHTVYSFLPIFDSNTPTIVGATIVYEVKR